MSFATQTEVDLVKSQILQTTADLKEVNGKVDQLSQDVKDCISNMDSANIQVSHDSGAALTKLNQSQNSTWGALSCELCSKETMWPSGGSQHREYRGGPNNGRVAARNFASVLRSSQVKAD